MQDSSSTHCFAPTYPQSYVSCSYMGMGRSIMGFISGGPFWNGAIYISTAQQIWRWWESDADWRAGMGCLEAHIMVIALHLGPCHICTPFIPVILVHEVYLVLQIFTHMWIWAASQLSGITWQKPDKDMIFFSQSAFCVLLSHALPLAFNPSTCTLKLWIPKGDSITLGICWPVTNLCHLKHITNIWSKHPISIWLSIHIQCFLGGHGSLYDCEWRCAVNVFQN